MLVKVATGQAEIIKWLYLDRVLKYYEPVVQLSLASTDYTMYDILIDYDGGN